MQINRPRCRPGRHSGVAGPNTMRSVKSNESQTRLEFSLNLGIFFVSVCVHLSTLCSSDPAKLITDGQCGSSSPTRCQMCYQAFRSPVALSGFCPEYLPARSTQTATFHTNSHSPPKAQ
ncbi:hypothetical protein ATANTOWER_029239 [Ataeniobius toweri]|uniref:Uncharacterized protein n=1 Tax=Ataeniobius toweri TaxID=208326 RepID=A0ABU7C9T3_9TELE|nr:hypothetical protein [Ataeniobius toweri]